MDAGGGLAGGVPPGGTTGGGCVFRIAPIIKNSVPIPIAEINSDNFLPRDSTKKKMNSAVATTFTTPGAERSSKSQICRLTVTYHKFH